MRKILLIGATLIGAVMLVATPVSVKWSGLPNISNIVLGIDQAQSRVGHPGSAVSVAGVQSAQSACGTALRDRCHLLVGYLGRSLGRPFSFRLAKPGSESLDRVLIVRAIL